MNVAAVQESSSTLSTKQLIHEYKTSNLAAGRSPSTVTWYDEILLQFRNYLVSRYHSDNISYLTIRVVRSYILHLSRRPKYKGHPYTPEQTITLSPRTIQCHVRALKAFSTWLHSEGYTTENRLKNLKLPKAPVKTIQPLTPAEINKIIGSVNKESPTGVRNHAILVTMLDTGLRASEVASITLGNLNLQDGYVKVMGKGAKERVAPLGKYVRMVVWHYIDRVRPKSGTLGSENLFVSANGQPITVNTIKLMFSRLAKTSGINRLHAHLCRHTFALNYLLNGGDIFSLKEILGHSSMEMVNNYLYFSTAQLTWQHHRFSPMDKLYGEDTGETETDTAKSTGHKKITTARNRKDSTSSTTGASTHPRGRE